MARGAVQQSGRVDAAARAKLSSEAGTFAFYRADFDRAIVLHGEALELYREVGDDNGVAFALLCLGAQYCEKGDYECSTVLGGGAGGLSQKWEQAEHRRHPSKPRGGGAPEGQLRAGEDVGHGEHIPGARDGGQVVFSHR